MIASFVLLAQLAGGAVLMPSAPASLATVEVANLPNCSPTLIIGTPCIWNVLPKQAFSTSRPGKFIWVAVIASRPEPFPGADPTMFVRRSAFTFSIDFYPQGADPSHCRDQHEEYRIQEQYGAPCPE